MQRSPLIFGFFMMFIAIVFVGAPVSPADAMDVPATGQAQCYDTSGNAISCANTGMDGETRGGVIWPDPRFVANADTTITDQLTGLSWAPDGSTPTVGTCTGGKRNWDQMLVYVDCLNSESYLGHTDWRAPNVRELASIVNEALAEADCGGSPCASLADWLLEQGFSGVISTDEYWASTSEGTYPGVSTAYQIDMEVGQILYSNKDNSKRVWPVRGTATSSSGLAQTANDDCSYYDGTARACLGTGADGDLQAGIAWPVPRFTDNGDGDASFVGTVTDNLTGLTWLKDADCIKTKYVNFDQSCTVGDGQVDWDQALAFVAAMNAGTYPDCAGGHTDWRLPNLRELWSLAEYSTQPKNDALPSGHPFENDPPGWTWTSTTVVTYTDPVFITTHAWAVGFTDGRWADEYKADCNPVWPVRGGVAGDPDIAVASSIDMGAVEIGAQVDADIVINNEGTNYLYLGSIGVIDPLAAPFSIVDDPCSDSAVAPGGSCTMTARFAPDAVGDASDSFDIPMNDPKEKIVLVGLMGTGKEATQDTGTSDNSGDTTGTQAPNPCDLVFPDDGQTGLGTEVTLIWKKSTDAASPTYDLDMCDDESFTGCSTIENVAMANRRDAMLRFAGNWLKALVAGPFVLAGCGGGGTDAAAVDDLLPATPEVGADEMSYTVTGLTPGTTYYWKVTVSDGSAATASAVRRFTTN